MARRADRPERPPQAPDFSAPYRYCRPVDEGGCGLLLPGGQPGSIWWPTDDGLLCAGCAREMACPMCSGTGRLRTDQDEPVPEAVPVP